MRTRQLPILGDLQIVGELAEQRLARHDAAGEELARHPVGRAAIFERIRVALVREHVDEQRAAGDEPRRELREQRLVVAHVLEHLDRHDPVVARRRELERADVRGPDGEVAEAALGGGELR